MRRMQRRVLLRVTSMRLRGPSLLLCHPVLPRNLAKCGRAKRGEGRGGKTRQRYATVVQSYSLRYLIFISSRMGQLRHTAPSLRLFILNSLTVCHHSFLPWAVCLQRHFLAWLLPQRSFSNRYIRSLLRPARPE
jgi:hypothetical protein